MGSVSEASFMPSEGRSQQWRHHLCQVREVSTGEIKWVFQRHHLCQVRRSLHSPLFSRRTPGGLHRTQPIQNAEFLALEVLQFSSDFPVTFRCMLAGLVSLMDFPAGLSAGMSPDNS